MDIDNRVIKKATTADREERIWALRVKGWSQCDIAKEVNLSQPAVSLALKRATEKHHERFMSEINEYKKEQTALLEEAGLNALRQYYKSQEPQIKTTQHGKYDNKKKQFIGTPTTTIEKSSQCGDSKLLGAFFKAQEEIRKIWGFDTPSKESSSGTMNTSNMSVDEKVALFTSIPIEERLKLVASLLTNKPVFDETDK